jgi:hypothetical protein
VKPKAELICEILHLVPGRIRLRCDDVKGQPRFAQRIQAHLEAVTSIERVTVNTRTGSVLVRYDPPALSSPAFVSQVSKVLGELFPGSIAPGHLRLRMQWLKGKPGLARLVERRLASVPGIHRIQIDPTSGRFLLVYDASLVVSPDFLKSLSDAARSFLPRLDSRKLLAFAGPHRS